MIFLKTFNNTKLINIKQGQRNQTFYRIPSFRTLESFFFKLIVFLLLETIEHSINGNITDIVYITYHVTFIIYFRSKYFITVEVVRRKPMSQSIPNKLGSTGYRGLQNEERVSHQSNERNFIVSDFVELEL